MFAYNLNNPVNRMDQGGFISVHVATIVAKTIIGGLISATCEFAIGGTLEDVAYAFVNGLISGFVSSFGQGYSFMVMAFDAANTVIDCYRSGLGIGDSLLAGAVDLICSLVYLNGCDFVLECLFDLTFGLGFSLVSSGFSRLLKSKIDNPAQIPEIETPISPYVPTTNYPSGSSTISGYQPSHNGKGWHPAIVRPNPGIKVPTVNKLGWTS